MTPLFIAGLGMQEIFFILLIVLLFFGGKKIPELMKGLGKGVKSFKDGMSGIETEVKADLKADEKTEIKTDATSNTNDDATNKR